MRQKPQSNYVMSFRHIFIITALSCCIFVEAGERWSRQLTEFTGETAPGNDWIPLSRSNERQHAARVLNYFTAPTGPQQQPFLSSDNTAQAQQHHFTFLNHQFPQSNRFVLQQQPQLQELGDRQQFHLSGFNQATADPKGQAFFHQRAPAFVGQMIQHPPPPPPPPPPSSPQGSSSNPFEQQFFSKDPLAETLHTEEEKTTVHVEQPFSYQHIRQQDDRQAPHQSVNVHTNSNTGGPISQEEVQLLYVPVETLFNQKSGTHPSSTSIESNRFNSLPQPVSPSLINEFYTAGTTTTPGPNSVRTVSPQSLRSSPYTVATTQSSQTLQPSSSTTKPKPNQPPLALFLFNDGGHGKLSTNEVLGGLKNINEIAVLDAVSKNSPKVFIGPSGLTPPKSYSRFDLPYLSSVDQSTNRANRKIDEHPFFVAPLSYNTPSGYTKIALPSPHVGSIIVRQSISSNSLEQETQYTRPTSQSNVQYYTPSTFNFPDTVTKQPTRQVYDADLYTTPTRKTSPSQAQFNSFSQNQNISPTLASRNSPVDEEYFNLAKTKKPTVTPPTQKSNYPLRPYATGSTRQFDFKPMPDHKIPSFYDASSNSPTTTPITTTSTFTTTTENPSTNPHTQFDVERLRTHFREENFRSRRPHQQQTSTERYDQTAINVDSVKETDFVHKFKLVDSVRPTHTKSVVDNGYLDFFQNPTRSSQKEEGIKTIATTILPGRAQEGQAIRNNYYTAAAAIGEEQVSARQKYVSTYFSPELSTTAGTAPPTTATTTLTTQDAFFREFEQKSKFYEREPKYEMPHRYETETFSESHRYSADTTKPIESTTPSVEPMIDTTADQQQYSIPSELPPISANLPGLVNALMDDPWAVQPKDSRTKSPEVAISPVGANRASNFRKQLHRTTAQPSSQDFYDSEPLTTTTKRPLQRSRRPHPSRTTTATPEYTGAQTSSSRPPISRSRSRYVPNNDERPVAVRSRGRSRLNTPREPSKQEENLDYQRDVLKQNYPVIRPQSSNGLDIATTAAPTTTAPTTLSYKETNEAELADRFISTTLTNEVPLGNEPVTRKYSIQLSQPYESEVMLTTGQPLQTTVFFSQTDEHLGDEVVRSHDVIPSDRNIETHSHSVIPLRSKQPTSSTEATVRQSLDQSVTEIENKITETTDLPRNENMELQKIETTTRSGRRPSLISRQRQNVQSTRTTTERPTTVHTTTAEIPRAAERRPAFVRRPSRLYATTTVPPTTTLTTPTELYNEQSTQGSYSLRTKNRQDILRGRTRRPTTSTAEFPVAATTASPDLTTRGFGRGGNQRRVTSSVRTRQEPNVAPTTQQTPSSNGPRFRIRERTRFTLQPQESQWSARLNQNSFQPILKSEARNIDSKDENTFQDPETEIVTAAQDSDVYLVNVSSKYKQKDSEEAEFSEDSTEKRVSSFADLLNDVMKDFIQDNNDKETFLPKGQALLAKSNHRELGEEPRRPSNNRNNFLRKRKQPKVIDSFETAESQHINHAAQVLNSPAYIKDSLKNIDLVGLTAKNDNLLYGNQKTNAHPEDEENTAHEETTANSMKDRSEEVMEVDYKSNASLADSVNFTTALPTEELSTMINVDQTTTSLSILQDSAIAEAVTTIPTSNKDTNIQLDNVSQQGSGIFDDVKKKISDLYEMADNDSDTEEEIDGVQIGTVVQGAEVAEDMYIETTDETLLQEVKDTDDGDINDAEADMASSETQFESVVSDLVPAETPKVDPMGSLVIPTSISSGITHDTEICYRGRCIKTDKKDKTG